VSEIKQEDRRQQRKEKMSGKAFLEQTIFTAIWKGNLNSLKTLLDKNNLECFDAEHQRTPLLWSCFYGNKTITPYLIDFGSNIEATDKVI
jgi:hypothetical protein